MRWLQQRNKGSKYFSKVNLYELREFSMSCRHTLKFLKLNVKDIRFFSIIIQPFMKFVTVLCMVYVVEEQSLFLLHK